MDNPSYQVVEPGASDGEVGEKLRIAGFLALLVVSVSIVVLGGIGVLLGLVWLAMMAMIPVACVTQVLIPMVQGLHCPQCGERRLVRVACISFGARFYRCSCCGLRCKRECSNRPWLDASGREDDSVYKRKPGASWTSLCVGSLPTRRDRIDLALSLGLVFTPIVVGLVWSRVASLPAWYIPSTLLGVLIISTGLELYRDRTRRARVIGPALWDRELDE